MEYSSNREVIIDRRGLIPQLMESFIIENNNIGRDPSKTGTGTAGPKNTLFILFMIIN